MCGSHKQLGENPDLKASFHLWIGLHTETFVSALEAVKWLGYVLNDLLMIPQWFSQKSYSFDYSKCK